MVVSGSETKHAVMSTCHAKEVVLACKLSQQKMQAVADMLLLTSDMRPVQNDKVSGHGESYPKYRDTVVTKTKGLLVTTSRMNELVYSVTARWQDVCTCIHDICELVVSLAECCAHLAYLVGMHDSAATPAVPGIVDSYRLRRAKLDIELSCQRLKQTNREMLLPPLLVQICSALSSNLGELTESCKSASELAPEPFDQDQFKHCIKSFTACGSCLLSSIRYFKKQPNELHQQRCINFCEPLLASVRGMISFTVEEQFTGKPAVLPTEARDNTKGILGACMSLVSGCIQLCRIVRDLAYDNTNAQLREQISKCTDAISKSSTLMADALTKYTPVDRTRPLSYYR